MGDVIPGYTWAAGETVTPTKLNSMLGSSLIAIGISQIVSVPITELDSVTASMPVGTPTITDGAQFFNGAIVPRSASNKIEIGFCIQVQSDGVPVNSYLGTQISIFRDSTWICTRFVPVYNDGLSGGIKTGIASISVIDSPSSTSSVAYTARIGGQSTVPLDISINNVTGTSYGLSTGTLKELVGIS